MPSRHSSTGRLLLLPRAAAPASGVDWLALLQAKAAYAWDGTSGLSADRLTWTDLVAGRVVTSMSAPGAATFNGHAAVEITAQDQGYRRSDGDVEIINPFTILAVFDSSDVATVAQHIFDSGSPGYIAAAVGNPANTKWRDNAWRGDTVPTLGAQVMRWTQIGTTTSVYRNGVLITSGTGTARNIGGGVGVFSNDGATANAALGIAAHLSLYSSEANAIEVEASALTRFGIA